MKTVQRLNCSAKQVGAAYLDMQIPWEKYMIENPNDRRNASNLSGSPEADHIAQAAKKFLSLFDQWRRENPPPDEMEWAISFDIEKTGEYPPGYRYVKAYPKLHAKRHHLPTS